MKNPEPEASQSPEIESPTSDITSNSTRPPNYLLIILLILFVIFLILSGFLYLQLQSFEKMPNSIKPPQPNNLVTPITSPTPNPPTPTQIPIPSISPLPQTKNGSGTKYQFQSQYLNLSFEYPIEWGEIKESLQYGDTGKRFDIVFDGEPGGSALGFNKLLVAGGRTKDFSEGRGGYITDAANGFSSVSDFCNSSWGHQGVNCIELKPNIITQLIAPKYDDVCPPNPGQYWFSKRVWVNLSNQPVDGFMMEYSNFWSDNFKEMQSEDLDCTKTDKQKFEAKVSEITNKLQNGNIDQTTKENLNNFDEFVKSIKI